MFMDKLLHFFICMCIVLVGWALLPVGTPALVMSCIVALGVGLGKEFFDYTRDNTIKAVDYKDILADAAGIIAALAVIMLNNVIYG